MNKMNTRIKPHVSLSALHRSNGVTLLDVLLAMVIFVIGMLALAHLQGNLTRSSTDANSRTVAASIAEETIEGMRAFEQISSAVGKVAYNDIAGKTFEVNRGGVIYDVVVEVREFFFQPDGQTPSTTPPTGVTKSDFKYVELVVDWTGSEFQVGDGVTTSDRLGSGSFKAASIIPAIPALNNAKVAADDDGALGAPPVIYSPGFRPDVIALLIDEDGDTKKFKESTSPLPDVFRDNTETWFDVVTYNQVNGGDAVFLRREEFVAVSCECTLQTSGSGGLRPTLWNGFDYTQGEFVDKVYGVVQSKNAKQSNYCDVCCRDHHDGGSTSSENVYNPLAAGGTNDHSHYGKDNQGKINVAAAGDGEDYVEACRLIRKDGFLRVTHDANQQGFFGFPEGYLEFPDGAMEYSTYLLSAVTDYYENDLSSLPQPNPPDPSSSYDIPAGESSTATDLPTVTLAETQQLRSRGVYTDYLTAEAELNIYNCFDGDGDRTQCQSPAATTPLELYPFHELQLTWLARWNATPSTGTVDVTNDPIATNNTHKRGNAFLDGSVPGQSIVEITSNKGNLGLTATGPIDDTYDSHSSTYQLYVDALDSSTPVSPVGYVVSGAMTSAVAKVEEADLMLETNEFARCGQTDTKYSCQVVAAGATLTVSNYSRKGNNTDPLWICSTVLTFLGDTHENTGGENSTTFKFPGGVTTNADIWITENESDCR